MQKEKNNKRTRLAMCVIALIAAAAVFGGIWCYRALRRDQNFIMRHTAKPIEAGETVQVSYESGRKSSISRTYVPVYCFTPAESASYTVTLADITNTPGVYLKVSVLDQNLAEHAYSDNFSDGGEGVSDQNQEGGEADPSGSSSEQNKDGGSADTSGNLSEQNQDSGSADPSVSSSDQNQNGGEAEHANEVLMADAFLSKGKKYYIIVDVGSPKESAEFSGSFSLTVDKTPAEEAEIQEIAAGESVKVTLEPNENATLAFRPEEAGNYRFESVITGKRAVFGYSGIAAVTSEDGEEKELFGGAAYLEAGESYYVEINADDTENKKVHADVTCSRVEKIDMEGPGTAELSGETLIEWKAATDGFAAFWSESEGDPCAAVYDTDGVPVNSDNDSGKEFSGNKKDFALVFEAKTGETYRILVGGKIDAARVSAGAYVGDGTTLGPDDVETEEETGEEAGADATADAAEEDDAENAEPK